MRDPGNEIELSQTRGFLNPECACHSKEAGNYQIKSRLLADWDMLWAS